MKKISFEISTYDRRYKKAVLWVRQENHKMQARVTQMPIVEFECSVEDDEVIPDYIPVLGWSKVEQ